MNTHIYTQARYFIVQMVSYAAPPYSSSFLLSLARIALKADFDHAAMGPLSSARRSGGTVTRTTSASTLTSTSSVEVGNEQSDDQQQKHRIVITEIYKGLIALGSHNEQEVVESLRRLLDNL